MKKLFTIILGLFLIIGVTGCFDNKKEGKDATGESSKSRLAQMYGDMDLEKGLHMAFETIYNGKTMNVDTQRKGENTYTKSIYGEDTSIVLILGDDYYTLSPKTKTGTKMKMTEKQKTQYNNTNNMESIEKNINNKTYTSGKMEQDGKEYYYEEYDNSNEGSNTESKIRFLFSGKELKYSITYNGDKKESVMKYTAFNDEIDDSLFKVPSGYKIVEY